MAALLGSVTKAPAATYNWIVTSNRNWNNNGNWSPSSPGAGSADTVIDASTNDLTAAATINLNNGTTTADRTVGTIIFGDTNAVDQTIFNWTVNANGGVGSDPKLILAVSSGTGTVQVNNGTVTLNPVLAGTQGFAKTGAGTLNLTNGANTLSGGITLVAGTLGFVAGALGSNPINVNGTSSLNWNTAGDVTDLSGRLTLAAGATLTLGLSSGPADNTVFASTIATSGGDTGGLVKGGAGILTITAPQNYTGGTRVNNGRLVLTGGDNRLSSSGALSLGNGSNGGIVQLGSNQTVTGFTISGSGTNAIVGGSASVSNLTIDNSANVSAANSPLLGGAGTNENNLALVKTGAGSLTLSKANTFTGDLTIGGGAVIATNTSALGSGTKTVTISGTANAPGFQLNLASGISVPASVGFVTSNDNATAPAILNTAGANIIGGNLALADTGFGGTQTRVKVNAGSLLLAGNIAPAATAASDRTLILDGAANGAATGTLADTGVVRLGVTKTGAGTWSLTNAGSYSGPTSVDAGRLNTTTAQTGAGALTVTGATLGLSLAAAGQSLAPAAVSISSATLAFNLGSFANPTAPLIDTGTFTVTGTNSVAIAGTGLSVGAFPLVKYTGALGGDGFTALPAGNLPSSALPARVTANLVDDTAHSQVLLNISAFDVPKWTATISNDWDINDGADPTTGTGSLNWKEAASGTVTRYLQTGATVDSVLFDDTAASATVNLTAALAPSSATVNTAATYTFGGPGKLSGAATLTKQGSGTLILANTGGNDFTGATTISAGTLQLGDGFTANGGQLGTGEIVNNGTLALNRLEPVTVANVIGGSGALLKQGANTVTLTGNNTLFSGPITVAAGTLKIGNNNALGDLTFGTTVAGGATLDATGFTIADSVLLGGTLSSTAGTSAASGAVTLQPGSAVDVAAGTLTLGSTVTGSGGLVKNNAGTLTLTGSSGFTGGATVNGGTLRLSGASGFTGGVTLNAGSVIVTTDQAYTGGTTVVQGTLQIGASSSATSGNVGSGDIALNPASPNTATLTILRGDSVLNVSNNITSTGTGTNAVTIGATGSGSPSGIVTFSGTNTFTGNVTINGGALKITQGSALGVGPKVVNVQANSRPALLLDGSAGDIALASGIGFNISSDGTAGSVANNPGGIVNLAGNNTIHGNIAVTNGGGGNGKIVANGGVLTLAGILDATGATGARTLLLGGSAAGQITGIVADWFDATNSVNRVLSVSKDGAGTWTLSGLNTFTGAVTVQEGTLKVGFVDLLGSPQPLGAASTAVALGGSAGPATLEYTGETAGVARPISVAASSQGGIVKNSGGGELTLGGNIVRNNSTSLTLTGGSFDVTGAITGGNAAASIVVSATQAKFSAANSYLGLTRVQDAATLRNGIDNALPTTTTLTLDGVATYDLNGFNQTVTGLATAGTGSKTVTNGGESGTNTLTVTGAGTFDGVIQGATALTKSTSGTFTLTNSNTYTGPTVVTGGTLALSGSLSGTVSVSVSGGSLVLGASDRINNSAALTLGGGSFNTAGFSEGTASTPGLGALILSASSTIDFGPDSGSTLSFASVGEHAGGTLSIVNWSDSGDRLLFAGSAGDFESAYPQSDVSFNGAPGYAALQFDQNHFEIVAVPEPSSTALIGSAFLLGVAGFRERRRFHRNLERP